MFPTLAFPARAGANIASWILAHAGELGDAYPRLSRPALAAVSNAGTTLERIGSAIVADHDGRREILGLLHRHSTSHDGVAAAVDGIGGSAGEAVATAGLLTSLSMIGLGVSVLSQAHVAFQFARLTERLKRLQADVQELKEMMHADLRGELNAGLIKLTAGFEAEAADPGRARVLLHQASDTLTNSTAKYIERLAGGVGAASPPTRWMLARHLIVSVLAEATVHTRLEDTRAAVQAIGRGLKPLRQHARAVFDRTVGAKPGKFLMPALAAYGVSLEVVAELYRQAGHAGVVDGRNTATAADVFESLRERLADAVDPVLYKTKKVNQLRAEFAEASAAVEEVNRVQGLQLAIENATAGTGMPYATLAERVLREVTARRPQDGTCLAVFPFVFPAAGR